MRTEFILVLLLAGVCTVFAQQEQCQFQTKCNDCIQAPGCLWCSKFKPNPTAQTDRLAHCFPEGDVKAKQLCEEDSIENPENTQTIITQEALTGSARKSKGDGETIVQLRPQQIRLKLRKGLSEKVKLTYRQAHGYPIDLYYLMDHSNSMADDKLELARLGTELTDRLRNLTELYHIGFGSFVDKVVMPFVDTHPSKIDHPCDGCPKAYSFRNDLELQSDGDTFTERVKATKISGNLDAPEGGFDALMQVIVCEDQIKWRKKARRIIVYSTDAQFHQAGDGKLAGIVIPNDETCHLNEAGEYDAYDRFDYPSIGQINKVTKDKDIYVIFAVSNHDKLYSDLTKFIENSSYGKLSKDSGNVVGLVTDQYNKITSKIRLTDNSSDAISIEYSSNCKNKTGPLMKTDECIGMREGDEVEFTLSVKLKTCPNDLKREIVEVKTLLDSLILEVEFECECNCETEDDHNIQSPECNDQGAIVCGVCACFYGYRGEDCRCNADGSGGDDKDEDRCKAPNATELCQGRGLCVCGACDCFDDFSGTFCQCNERKCLSDEGDICSNKGTCSCEQCSCINGFTGDKCQCPTDNVCSLSAHHEICSGRGECDCGECKCDSSAEVTYGGRYCEDCLTCEHGKCSEFYRGVLCWFRDPASNACNLTTKTPVRVDSLKDFEDRGDRRCSFVDEDDGCMIIFTYRYVDSLRNYELHVLKDKQCPEPAPIMGIVFGILAGIVLIGLLTLLLWKLLTTVHDRNEYAKFEKDRLNAKWNTEGNPLYKDPTNTFANPVFSQQQAN